MLVPHRLVAVIFAAASLVACSPKLDLPPDALIDCSGGQQCPGDLVCSPSVGRCVKSGQLTEQPPAVVAGSVSISPTRAKAGMPVTIAFDVTKPLASVPIVEVQTEALSFPAVPVPGQSSGQHYVFTYMPQGPGVEKEGQADCLVSLIDTVGITATGLPLGKFALDFSAPTATAVVQYLAAPGNPLGSAITRAGAGTVVRVTVYSNETLGASTAPVLTASNGTGSIDTFTRVDLTDRTATFEATIPAGLSDSPGQYIPSVAGWSDDLGNSATVVLSDAPIAVETAQPDLQVAQSQVEYLRSPWGNQTADAADGGSVLPDGGFAFPSGPYFAIAPPDSLSGDQTLPAGTFQLTGGAAITRVRFWSNASLENFLGEAAPEASGAWPRARLAALDLPSLYVTALDEAGNESAPVKLANAEWVATPRVPSVGTSPNLAEWAPIAGPAVSHAALESTVIGGSELSGTDTDGILARAEGAWHRRVAPLAQPSTREDPAMAYDSARGKVVMFGGYGGSRLNDTWEWDGSTWVDRTPAGAKPSPRNGTTLAYDAARGRVVLFGGLEGTGQTLDQDVWEWDGTTWLDRTTSGPKPPARHHATMAYDSRRGKIVLFGGATATSQFKNDLWEWDGLTGTWTDRTPATLPPEWPGVRDLAGMAYDALHGQVLLFGGWAGGNYFNDLWAWDGQSGTWTNLTPSTLPPNWPGIRTAFGMTFDSGRGVTVVLGGGGDYDTWEWDGSSWTRKIVPFTNSPSNRLNLGLAYDKVHQRTVLFGGVDASTSNFMQDTWLWDGTHWGKVASVGQSTPAARFNHSMAYDSNREVMLAFGGQGTSNSRWDLWEWDGRGGSWTDRTPATLPSAWPVGRSEQAMAYDSGRQLTVMFGGFSTGNGGYLQDVWEWDASNSAWIDRTPTTIPPAWPTRREGSAMVYDAARGVTVLFGGLDFTGTYSDEIWEWDGANGVWTNRTPATRPASWPTGRTNLAMAYDSTRDKVLLFSGSGSQVLPDLWEWDGNLGTFTNLTPSTLPASWPSARVFASMAYDSIRRRTVLFGGFNSPSFPQDVWEWDGASWVDRTPAGTKPASESGQTMAFDAARGVTVVFGGNIGGQLNNDVWEWSLDSQRQPEVQLTATGANPGLGPVTGLRVRARCGGFSPIGASQDGAALLGWWNGLGSLGAEGWSTVATNASGLSATVPYLVDPSAALIDWTASSQGEAQQFVLDADARAAFQCRPLGSSGTSSSEAMVAADYLEVRIKYLAP
jgi:hypothetical protein